MTDVPMSELPQVGTKNHHAARLFAACIVLSFPLLIVFPKVAGWHFALMAIAGLATLLKYRSLNPMDWQFLVVCLIIPASHVWNMLMTGWEPGYLERPAHLLLGFMIYYLIGRFGLRANALFYAACAASFAALSIALYEAVYLGNERVFGLGHRWNAVPFGNFSILFGFFCLGGLVVAGSTKNALLRQKLLALAGFICGLIALLLSGTRGGLLALPFLLLLCISLNTRISKQPRRMTILLTAAAIIFVVVASENLQNRFALAKEQAAAYISAPDDLRSREGAVGIRLGMWHWGLKKFQEKPYTGIGIASYKEEREKAVKSGQLPAEFSRLANLHNELITSLALGGLPSAIALIAFWILAWRFFYLRVKTSDDDQYYFALCGLLAVTGTALFSMTEGLFGTSPGTKAIILSLAIPAGALRYHCVTKRSTSVNAFRSIAKF